jgi:hypothetical protein
MKKMQWPGSKNILILFIYFLLLNIPSFAQTHSYRLQTADSLFNARQYTQSLEHYQQIFKDKQYSPAMLLKMAFINEGLNKIGDALYYLNLYYIATNDDSVLGKMEELSGKNRLQGYDFTEADQAYTVYRQYHLEISLTLAVLIFFFFCLSVFIKRRKQQPLVTTILLFMFSFFLICHLAFGEENPKAIIARGNTYIMEGPSGAAAVLDIVNAGHRLEVIKHWDVWIQIRWKGKTAFVKEDVLLPVLL